MEIAFDYNKRQVLQALRYHFVSKIEMRIMIILVNVFALISLGLYLTGRITPTAFLVYAFLWISLMLSLWFVLPGVVYRRSETFRHGFRMQFLTDEFRLIHEQGQRSWPYSALQTYKETPHFFHLYYDPRSFLLVPKSAFEDLETMRTFRQLLKEKITKK
ncbi:hypothetical protein GCM10027051_02440 [Niabella terrae]